MLKFLVIGGIFVCAFLVVGNMGQGKMIGPGKWSVLNIMKCENDDDMEIKVEVNRRKVNRTHDGFNCNLTLEKEDIDDTYAVRLDICKVVDGGCKDYSTMGDDSLIKFVKKYAEGNVRRLLEAAGLDPPDFPLLKGIYHILNFLFDYNELPPEGPYGEFMGNGFLIKGGKELACLKAHVLFEEKEEDDCY